MYQIKCDDYILYDPRDDELILLNPKCKLQVNTAGEASFTIFKNHPFFAHLQKLKSIFEIRQNNQAIFRGRMTEHSCDFYNQSAVDLEGILAVTNDTQIAPFVFPKDFENDAEYIEASTNGNVVQFFLNWVIKQHNAHAASWQQLKVGNVTVSDPNNYITKSSDKYLSTWEVLKSKLFESNLGGYLYVRYEDDGNYIDYVDAFQLTNTQQITVGENMLDIDDVTDASETYSAILPLGVETENEDGTKSILTIESLPDGDLTDDLVKEGKYIYSKSAREQYGWICVPIADSTWNDVTQVNNLKSKAVEYLSGNGMMVSNTITIKAVDLSFSDSQIQSFRVYRNIVVNVPTHGISEKIYPLTKLDIDILNPQNTTITIGDTIHTLIDINDKQQSDADAKFENVANELTDKFNEKIDTSVNVIHQTIFEQRTAVMTDCETIILSALKSYVETGNYNEFKETVEAQLLILADNITMNFTRATENINNVGGDLQAEIIQRKKHINFSENGITIGAGENAMTLELDNNMIKFKKNGVQFGWWDGVDFHTGNIIVEVNERAQFGNFAFVPRSDGSLMFLKVGD